MITDLLVIKGSPAWECTLSMIEIFKKLEAFQDLRLFLLVLFL
jgi:hypothetical protein